MFLHELHLLEQTADRSLDCMTFLDILLTYHGMYPARVGVGVTWHAILLKSPVRIQLTLPNLAHGLLQMLSGAG